ncbi:MAG: hypothetical protein QM820_14835 [Minicystis sp.]
MATRNVAFGAAPASPASPAPPSACAAVMADRILVMSSMSTASPSETSV